MFFRLEPHLRAARLSDIDQDLVTTYAGVRDDPEGVIAVLARHEVAHSKPHYLETRKRPAKSMSQPERAARFIYLNKASYNGMYRVNFKGDFNADISSDPSPNIRDPSVVLAASRALRDAHLAASDFADISPNRGDFVYADPPYDGGYARYGHNIFTDEDHRRLAAAIKEWVGRGVHVMASNRDTPLVRGLYGDFHLSLVSSPRWANSVGRDRGTTPELLITSYDHGVLDTPIWDQPTLVGSD